MLPSPKNLYEERLRAGRLKPDAGQASAIAVLDALYARLMESANAAPASWLERIAGFNKTKALTESPSGVYLYGGVGRGKSMLMDLFYESLPPAITKQRVHFHAFMIGVHDYLHQRREQSDETEALDGLLPMLAARIAERSRVLCFDEFHVTDVADAMILGRLFTSLFERGVTIVATSNWPPERLYENGLQRDRFLPFIALMQKRMQVVPLDGAIDYRTQFLQQEGTYFTPLGEMTTRLVDDLFAGLVGAAAPSPETLTVKGRTIMVKAAAAGVARFTFAQLCEQPHGAEDYLAIAARYRMVFLEGVPKIGYDRRNEAKRLMILIDALYERKTKLVITADAPPERLYQGHDHGFEFQRTISRLQEMQSPEYLKAA